MRDDVGDHRPIVHGATGVGAEEFERLYARYAPALFTYLAHRVGSDAAEDLTAETFAIVWARRHDYDPTRAAFSTWLFGIAVNLVRRHRRQEDRYLGAAAGRTAHDVLDEELVVDRLVAQQRWPRVVAELALLGRIDREIITLWAWSGLSYAEIAAALGLPVGTVRSRLSRARQRLAVRVDRSDHTQGRCR